MKTIESLTDLTPDPANANIGTLRGDQLLSRSLDDHGAGRSILVDKNGVVVAGSKTFEQAVERGLAVRVVQTTGDKLVVVQRTDLDLDDAKTRELAYLDNRASEQGLMWDRDQLVKDLGRGIQFGNMFAQDELDAIVGASEIQPALSMLVFDDEGQHERWLRFLTYLAATFPEIPPSDQHGWVPVKRLDAWLTLQLQKLADEVPTP